MEVTIISKINRKTIKDLPQRNWNEVSNYSQILLVPSGLKHDSGFMMIAIVGRKKDGDFEVAAYPDDIVWDFRNLKQLHESSGMRTDCYYPNGIQHFWGNGIEFIVHGSYSSTTIEVVNKITDGVH